MSYQTPVLDHVAPAYVVIVNHATVAGSGDIVCRIAANSDTESNADAFFQDFIDWVASSNEFVVLGAKKTLPSVQEVTVTP